MKKIAKKYTPLLLLVLASISCMRLGAQLNFYNPVVYTTNNGLSQSSVYGITQTKNGYMWFATGDGICRFDGREWKTYKTNFSHNNRPSSNLFNTQLHEDDMGTLWFANSSGVHYLKKGENTISIFCPDTDTLKHFNLIGSIAGIEDGHIIWGVEGSGRVFRFDNRTNACTFYDYSRLAYNQSLTIVSSLLCGNKIYLGLYNRILVFDIKSKQYSKIETEANELFVAMDIECINNNIYIASESGIYTIIDNRLVKTGIANSLVSRFTKFGDNCFFYTTAENTISLYNTVTKTIQKFSMPGAVGNNTINTNCYFKDRNSNLWIGTEGSGVIKTDIKHCSFNLINKEKNGISSNFIKGLLAYSKDTLLIGTVNSGLNIYNRKTGSNKVIMPGRNITFLYRDKKRRIWIGADDGIYVSAKNLQFEKVKLVTIQKLVPGANFVFNIAESPDGTVYFGTLMGLHYYNEEKKIAYYIFGNSYNLSIHFTDNNNVIISQYDGSVSKSTINQEKTKRTTEPLDIKARNPRAMLAGNNGVVWMATENGLLKYNSKTKESVIYDKKNGLDNLYLYAVLSDNKGNLWVSSNGGISVFDIKTERFRNFDVSYNLQSNEFNTGSYCKADDGELFFGGINGLNYFYPDSVVIDTLKPLQAITGIKIYEKNINADSLLSSTNVLNLAYNQNSIYLQFASFDFTAPDKNQFAYKLEGQDTGWSNIGNSNFIRFSALQPGTYNFWLKSANRDGTWCNPQKMLTIQINPPFWRTWWFITALIVVLVSVIGIIVFSVTRSRYRKKVELLEKEKALQKIRLQLSQDIHDDIGGNLSMIALMSDKIKDNPNAPKIAELARNAQKGFRELIWSVNPVHDDVANFTYYLRNHGNTFFENTPIDIAFDIPAIIPDKALLPNVRRNLFLTYKEALNNILKHSGATTVKVKIDIVDNQSIVISVEDNGKGLSADNANGNGLVNFEHRMQAIGGNFQLINKAPHGLLLIFKAPIG